MRCDYINLCHELDIEPESTLIKGWPRQDNIEETVDQLSKVIDDAESDLQFLSFKPRKKA